MKFKILSLALSLTAFTPASHAYGVSSARAFLTTIKSHKVVRHSSDALKIVSLATLTALLMRAASRNTEHVIAPLKEGVHEDTGRFVKLLSGDALLPGMAAIICYGFDGIVEQVKSHQKVAGNPKNQAKAKVSE